MDQTVYTSILGGQELINWFGQIPSFHDAEITELHLERCGISKLRIHGWNLSTAVRNGYFVRENHAVVEFAFNRITDLDLNGFNKQNVIDGLFFSREDAEEGGVVLQLSLEPCYGISGIIRAEEIFNSVHPGKPEN